MKRIKEQVLPPEESWLPGQLLGPVVLHHSDSLHVVFTHADVYPEGILLHVTARFRELESREARQEVGRQISAFHYAPADHEGPHLRYQPDGIDALPEAHHGGGRIWHLGYWIASDVAPLEYVFEWPAQEARSEFGFTREQVDEARRAARQLWPTEAGM